MKRTFAPGDMVHVYVPCGGTDKVEPRLIMGRTGGHVDAYTACEELTSTALIVSMKQECGHTYAYVLPEAGEMGWLKVSCCVRHLGDDGKDIIHEVSHMKVIKDMRENWNGESWFAFGMIMTLFACIMTTLIVTWTSLRADAKADGCYTTWVQSKDTYPGVSSSTGAFVIYAHIPWRTDTVIGNAPTAAEAHELMKQVCPAPVR